MCKLQSLLSSSNFRVLRSLENDADGNDDIGSAENMSNIGGEPSSARLWAMVNDFFELDAPATAAANDPIASARSGVFLSSCDAILRKAIQEMESILGESSPQDAVETKVVSCVTKALRSKSRAESLRNEQALPCVLQHLQREGFDAGLCMTARKLSNATGLPPTGGHRYIDVITDEKPLSGTLNTGTRSSEKLIVDVGFPVHFEIARPLPAYQKLIAMLPSTFVGKTALLQRVVRIMSQAAKASLESQDMPVPPWRSFSFLLAKWLSPSCSRITSIEKAKHIVLNASSTDHVKPHVLAELDYNTDFATLADSPVKNNCERGLKTLHFMQDDAATAWCPPPPIIQIPMNDNCIDDSSSSYTRKRRQASVISALALAIAETQQPHTSVAALERKVHNRPQPSAIAVSVL